MKSGNWLFDGPLSEREAAEPFYFRLLLNLASGMISSLANRPLSRNAETKDFARPTSHPVRGWTGKNKAFCSPGTQNGRRVIKVYCRPSFSPFPHIPPSGGFCKVSNISMHKIIMAVTVDETFICSKLGARSFGDGSQGISKYKESNMGQVAGF